MRHCFGVRIYNLYIHKWTICNEFVLMLDLRLIRDKHHTVSSTLFQHLCCWLPLRILCVSLTTVITRSKPRGERQPLSDLSVSFQISISFFSLSSPEVTLCACTHVCLCGVSFREQWHTLVPLASLSLTPAGFRAFHYSDELLICPLAEIKTLWEQDKIRLYKI